MRSLVGELILHLASKKFLELLIRHLFWSWIWIKEFLIFFANLWTCDVGCKSQEDQLKNPLASGDQKALLSEIRCNMSQNLQGLFVQSCHFYLPQELLIWPLLWNVYFSRDVTLIQCRLEVFRIKYASRGIQLGCFVAVGKWRRPGLCSSLRDLLPGRF